MPVVVDDHPFHAFAKKQILAPLADVLEEVRKQGALPSAGMQPYCKDAFKRDLSSGEEYNCLMAATDFGNVVRIYNACLKDPATGLPRTWSTP